MRVWLAFVFAVALQAQDRPEFDPSSVERIGGNPNVYVIHGRHLGPEQPCAAESAAGARALCGVVVLLGDQPAPLLAVQASQVAFVARQQGPVSLRIIVLGLSSTVAPVQLGADRVAVSQDGDAFVGMPVWVRIYRLSVPTRPITLAPRARPFCAHMEVWLNGALLPERQSPDPSPFRHIRSLPCATSGGPTRPSLEGRFALHLQYALERPGVYLVRYVPGDVYVNPNTAPSAWSPIEVKAASPTRRAKWLRELVAAAPTDRESLAYDFLPSIFGSGDMATLEVAKKYLHHPDPLVAATTAAYIRDYYPADVIKDLVR